MPAKSRHMQRRKERIDSAKKNARDAHKRKVERQWKAAVSLLVVVAALSLVTLWSDGFFEKSEEPVSDDSGTVVTDEELDEVDSTEETDSTETDSTEETDTTTDDTTGDETTGSDAESDTETDDTTSEDSDS